ncbi:MAG: GIY-YIG nuclease family protein [Ignavibacteriaceae bacterium]|nr:GIY-YIG nuclease family protein [Ignavibacteriaceae bacterium]
MSETTYGIVYVLTNPAMPGLVKIGKTSRDKIDDRMRELFTTSVPVPFDCEYACKVDDCDKVEKALHIAFGPNRIHPQREFFKIEAEQAIAIMSLLSIENVTPAVLSEIQAEMNPQDAESSKRFKQQRRPPLNFSEMGIPVGSVLKFSDGLIEVIVSSNRKVKYKDEEMSLTRVTRTLLELDYDVQPTIHWYYNGKNLNNIYNETYLDI